MPLFGGSLILWQGCQDLARNTTRSPLQGHWHWQGSCSGVSVWDCGASQLIIEIIKNSPQPSHWSFNWKVFWKESRERVWIVGLSKQLWLSCWWWLWWGRWHWPAIMTNTVIGRSPPAGWSAQSRCNFSLSQSSPRLTPPEHFEHFVTAQPELNTWLMSSK